MRITQGTFSFLPDLTDEQIAAQIQLRARTTAGRCRSSTPTTRTRATPTGRCGACRCSTCTRRGRRRAARGARVPRGLPATLHQAHRLRRDARPPDDRAAASSSTGRPTSPDSGSTGTEAHDRVIRYTHRIRTRPIGPPEAVPPPRAPVGRRTPWHRARCTATTAEASATAAGRPARPAGRSTVDPARAPHIDGRLLDRLDRELVGAGAGQDAGSARSRRCC